MGIATANSGEVHADDQSQVRAKLLIQLAVPELNEIREEPDCP